MDAPSYPAAPPARRAGLWALVACAALAWAGCSQDANPLAPYEGARPLDLLKVTQNFTPEVQWVGGRVAAVGVNRGTHAALDSTLVWMRVAPGNSIGSYVTVGQETATALIESYGGTPQDQLADGETYTFWIAERSAFDLGLDTLRIDPAAFADTTMAMALVLRGQSGGNAALGVTFRIERDEHLAGERFIVSWTPATARFRHLAIRQASTGGFQNLIWYLHSPDGGPALLAPPITIGEVPEGAEQVTEFTGFGPNVYFLWAATDDWTGSFSPTAPGYAWFRMFANNFPSE